MARSNVKPGEVRGRMFENPLLERLSRTHIAVPLTIFYGTAAGIIFYTLYLGLMSPAASILLFVGGFIFFTLVEYLIHKYAFHLEGDTPKKERLQWVLHGAHHDFPKDKERLAMPPLVSILLATTFFLIYRLIMGDAGLPFTAGFVAGYATYLCVHYSVHAYRPPNNFLKILWTHHAIHHYQQPERAFGVSSPLWDVIFHTMPEKLGFKAKTKSGFIDDRSDKPL